MKWFDRLPEIIFRKSVRSTVVCGVTALLTCSVFANPVINNVAAGSVSIQQTPSTTIIDQSSQKAIINWQSFNIGHNQATHFYQPTGGVALNRISPTQGASQIYGVLTATGQIILINPAGMYFGPSAYVNVGGMIATTENMSNTNFMNGLYQFSNVPGYSGAVVNDGQLITAQNGLIALVAPGVVNNGIIQANLGHVVLASGDAFTVSFSDDDISFAINAQTTSPGIDKNGNSLSAGVTNTGSIYADGGTILLTAQAAAGILNQVIDMQGVAQARSVSDNNGEIILSGDPDAGVVNVAATLDASGKSSGETGGTVDITGYNVLLNPSTLIDVSGDAGGGHIDVGGNTSSLPLSSSTVILPGVTLLANAINSGNGGLIETSGDYLQVNDINVSTTAPNGQIGTWLLDPTNIYIAANQLDATDAGMNGTDDSADTGSGSNPETFAASGSVQDSLLTTANLDTALNSTNVVVTTTNASGTGVGNINVVDPVAWTSTNSLTLNAANNINLLANGSITTGAAGSALILDAGGNVTQTGSGIIAGSGGVTVQSGAVNYTLANTYSGATTLNGGSLTMSGADGSAQDTDFTVNTGTTLTLDDTAAINTAGRIGSASSITLQGGEFIVNGSDVASTNVDEIVGALLLPSNASTVTVNAGSGGSTALTFASITRSAGATVLFRGTNLGANPGAGNTNIFFTNSSGLNLTGGGGAAGSTDINIVPYAIGDTSASGSGIGFVTYDVDTNSNSNGIRPLNTSTEYVLNSLTASNNVELTTGTTDVTTAASINSLLLNGGTLDFSTNAITKTIASGALAYLSGGGITSTTTATRILGFGSVEAIVEAIGSFAIESNISGSGGLTKSGAGTLTLGTQVKALTGTYTINSGTLADGIANAIATTDTLLIQNAGTFDLSGFKQTIASLQGSGTATDSSATSAVLLDSETGTINFTGTLTGTLGLTIAGQLTLPGTNTYSGITTLDSAGAILTLNSATALGTGAVTLSTAGATLDINFSNNTLADTNTITLNGALNFTGSNTILNNNITLTGATTIAGSGSGITLNGTINGADALTLGSLDSITLGGIIGGTTALASVTSSIPVTLNGASITTTGNQSYNSFTPGAATTTLKTTGTSGNITITQPLSWSTTNTLALTASGASGTLTLPSSITTTNGTLNLSASDTTNSINAASVIVDVGTFHLTSGQWIQIGSLPDFYAGNFQLTSGSVFIRALSGDGTDTPYMITDIYGLEGINSGGTITGTQTTSNSNYELANSINALSAASWSNGANSGFVPIHFTGTLNGDNYIISNLTINEPTVSEVGLFAIATEAAISNLGLTNVNIIGAGDTAGLVGFDEGNTTISNAYVTGTVTGTTDIGMLVGQLVNSSNSAISNSYSSGTISGTAEVGGLVGIQEENNNQNTINNSYSTANVSGTSSVGGLVGAMQNNAATLTISNSFATGNVTGTSDVGGLVGRVQGNTPNTNYNIITNSYSTGNVTGTTNVGGLVGEVITQSGGSGTNTISNSYSNSAITITGSGSAVGGLVGLMEATGIINDAYSTGYITGTATNIGGLVGSSTGSVNNSYWDTETSGQSSSAGGTGLTTMQMMQQASFSGWDFSTVWNIVEGQSYPFLQAFYAIAPRVISGITPAAAGTAVTFASNGTVLDSAYTSANGSYYFLAGDNLVSGINSSIADGATILAYLNSGSIVGNAVTLAPASNGSITGFNIIANGLSLGSNATATLSNATLATALGALSGSNYLYSVSGNNLILGNSTNTNVAFNTTANTTYNLNGNISPTNGATSSSVTFSGPVTANSNVSLIATAISFLNNLTGSGNITVTGANSNNTLAMQTGSAQIFGITSANAGTVSGMSGYTDALSFSNVQNLTGGNNGNTFNFSSNATLDGTINGTNLSNTNIINVNTYTEALKIVLSSTNNGVVQDMANNLITAFNNITNINTNNSYSNSLYTPSGQTSNIYITGGNTGYVSDPIYFNGVNTFIGASGSSVNFLTNATYDPVTNLYYINGVGMSFANFASYSGYTISSPVISVSNVVQQPPTNANQSASAPVTSSPTWVLAGTTVDQNITTITTDVSNQIDNNLKTVKINPYCYTAE